MPETQTHDRAGALIGKTLNQVHVRIGHYRRFALLAVKIRNQMSAVIGKYLGENCNPEDNGEYLVMEHVAPICRMFVDVGANIGNWSDRFLSVSHASGVLFEPSSEACARIAARLDGMRIDIRCRALSDYVGQGVFFELDECSQLSRLMKDYDATPGDNKLK